MNSRTSQEDRILLLLQAAWPSWVPAPDLARISLQYSRAVFSLRKRGWEISNRVIVRDGMRLGSFRLGPVPLPRSRELRASQQKKVTDDLIDRPEILFDLHREPD